MSYESKMLEQFAMPPRENVEQTLLRILLKHDGAIKEFGGGEKIVDEIADEFRLNQHQRAAFLETTYRKQNRIKKAFLWHRLLFRAADALASKGLVSRPTETLQVTQRREWMLTEKGFDEALKLCDIPLSKKEWLPTKSYEVQRIVKRLTESPRPEKYDPFDKGKKIVKTTKEAALRNRAFRQAIVEAYGFRCAVCGLKIKSPNSIAWEVEAAHIVPHRSFGRDDVWNGIALCHLHHWAFDVGWFTLFDDYRIQVSPRLSDLPPDYGKVADYEFFRALGNRRARLILPERIQTHPHPTAIRWHREKVFHQRCITP